MLSPAAAAQPLKLVKLHSNQGHVYVEPSPSLRSEASPRADTSLR